MNFGAFATPEQNILFDINDFDETLPGVDFTADLQAPSGERRGCRFGSQPFKKTGTGDRGDYRRSLSDPSAQLGKAFPVGNLAEFAREIKRIEHRGLRSELQGILVKARDNLVQDDNFPHR
jgi:hypothetical protein